MKASIDSAIIDKINFENRKILRSWIIFNYDYVKQDISQYMKELLRINLELQTLEIPNREAIKVDINKKYIYWRKKMIYISDFIELDVNKFEKEFPLI